MDTLITLTAFRIGLASSVHVEFANTMAFVTLSCSELLRAFTARSEFYPVLKIGPFTNRWMNMAVVSSLAMILAVIYVPFLQTVFKTQPLGWAQWSEILPLAYSTLLAAK